MKSFQAYSPPLQSISYDILQQKYLIGRYAIGAPLFVVLIIFVKNN